MLRELILKEECYKIVGLCMKVHTKLGKGFKEIVYKDALELELINAKIPYQRERTFEVEYEGTTLPHFFKADFLVFDSIILEIKAQSITPS